MDGISIEMSQRTIPQLRGLTTFPAIFAYLRDDLEWLLESENIEEEDITFEYTPEELGLAKDHATRITRIRQLRQLQRDQPWAVFYIEFENKQLPVTVLRSMLKKLTTVREDRPGWNMEDLLFITVQGTNTNRSVAFSHFRKGDNKRLPELRSFSWDGGETHFYYIQKLNLENLRWQLRGESVDQWRERWRKAFISRPNLVITESRQLATAMAQQTRFMRDAILETYELEHLGGTWHALMSRVQIELIHDLDKRSFADVIAQTITYGLFSAAEQNPDFTLADLVKAIPPTNPFLRDLLRVLVYESNIDLIELGIDRLIDLYRDADVPEIAHQFMRRTASGREDPVILFYEQFLSEYDRVQRVERGVFYTPDPVVHYIVHSVDAILKEEFGIAEGLASAEKDEHGQHRVQILDPATGTGTFLAHIIDLVAEAKNPSGKPAPAWNNYVANDLLPRLNGFELMMAPYAIAHMKLGLKLEQTGYQFESDQRLRVFLTNALNAPTRSGEVLGEDFLALEADAASEVKTQKKIMVVIGNPPYSGHSANNSQYISDLLRGKLPNGKKGANYFEVDGQSLNERNPRWLNDDYVKFIRIGQQRIEDTGYGVLAFISNNGYLDNPTFRGMRQSLMETFDAIFILDLHGNARKKETTPEGNKDENVFDIMQGVAIALFVKGGNRRGVYKSDLWGVRNTKYDALTKIEPLFLEFKTFEAQKPFYLFVEQDTAIKSEWDNFHNISSILPTNSVGIVTARDNLTIQESMETVLKTVTDFASLPVEEARRKYDLRSDSRDWKVNLAQQDLRNSGLDSSKIVRILYRPFDVRYTYYTGNSRGFLCMPRSEVMLNMLQNDNLALISARSNKSDSMNHFFATNTISEAKTGESTTQSAIFPIYLYPSNRELFDTSQWELSDKGRRPNFDKAFVDEFTEKLGLQFITDGRGDLANTFGPEDIFHYTYAVFHSPAYRIRYAEFLKIDFPRLPLTDNLFLFNQLVQRGADLVALHLLEDDYAAASWVLDEEESPLAETGVNFVQGKDGTAVGKFGNNNYDEKAGRVYLDSSKRLGTSYFEGIDNAVWSFQIGGYQVLHKWLYDRRATSDQAGRTLSAEDIEHYKRVVSSLHHTMLLMEDIDKIIDSHGGYPIVGSQDIKEDVDMMDFPKREKDLFGFSDSQMALGDIENPEAGEIDYEVIADGTEAEDTGNDQMEPFNPDDINIETKPFTLDLILKRIRRSNDSNEKVPDGINLSPAFQRKAGIWDDRKQSRLIESIFLRIPLPVFYVAEDQEVSNHWIVVDGLQRLTTLKRFVIDKTLKLKDLEFWGDDLNGKTWDSIPESLQVRIEEAQVVVHIIKRRTPEQVRFNIFKRINTGGIPLSAQEIRHALNQGPVTLFLENLANSKEFLSATDNGVSPKRQADRECALRFIAFSEVSYREYSDRDNLDTFFNRVMKAMNQYEGRYPEIEERFLRAMRAASAIFGNNAFRKILSSSRRSPVSKALFEVWSVILDGLDDTELETLIREKNKLIKAYTDLQTDPDFQRAISYSTGNTKQVRDRFSKIENLVQEVLEAAHA